MRLEGSLDAFGLPDILQLLAFTTKTGALHVRRACGPNAAPAAGVVHVRGGAIAAASSDVRHEGLARRIVAAGLVDDDALREAVNRVRSDASVGLVRALLEAEAVTQEAAFGVAREQAIDAVCELLRWAEGEFSFGMDEPDRDALPVTLPVDEVVSEGRRRLEAWPALTALIPSPAAVLSLSLNPPEDPSCSREEWALLSLVDGRRTVSDVVSLLGRGEYVVVRALAALVERGLLVSAGADSGGGGLADLVRRQAMLLEIERPDSAGGQASAEMTPAGAVPTAGPAARGETAPPDIVITDHETPNGRFADDRALAGRLGDALRVEEMPLAPPPPAPAPVTSSYAVAGRVQMSVGMPPSGYPTVSPSVSPSVSGPVPPQQQREPVQPEGLVPSTAGSGALDPAPAVRPAADAETQDSIVTKSLLLRLIAGVRGL